jgi:predicted RNA-binding protein with PUA-like domain
MACWLMKSEPDAFSITDLENRPDRIEPWNGVRNYQARNFMRDAMEIGDHAFFYHSNCDEPGIVGLMRIASRAYPDPTQFDRKSPYFDSKSTREEPRWMLVDVRFERHLNRVITLAELRKHARDLRGFKLLEPGNRLSILPVSPEHWNYILALENA